MQRRRPRRKATKTTTTTTTINGAQVEIYHSKSCARQQVAQNQSTSGRLFVALAMGANFNLNCALGASGGGTWHKWNLSASGAQIAAGAQHFQPTFAGCKSEKPHKTWAAAATTWMHWRRLIEISPTGSSAPIGLAGGQIIKITIGLVHWRPSREAKTKSRRRRVHKGAQFICWRPANIVHSTRARLLSECQRS